MDFQSFKSDIITCLGGNLVDVELTDSDIVTAFNRAVATWEQKGNTNMSHTWLTLPVTTGQRVYTLIDGISSVTRVIRPSTTGLSTDNPFHVAFIEDLYSGFDTNGSMGSTGSQLMSYDLTLQLLENIEKYSAYLQQFYYRRFTKEIELQTSPDSDDVWFLEVYKTLTDDQYRDVLWVHDWTLAECKIILGRAYSKFQSLSSPTGDTSLNGDSLIQEGKDDKTQLLQDIADYTDGEPIGGIMFLG